MQGELYVVGIDISGSRSLPQLQQGQALIMGLVAKLTFGDRLVLIQTYRAGTEATGVWVDSVPSLKHAGKITGLDRQRRDDFQAIAASMASVFVNPNQPRPATTDLFYTLGRAADYMRAAGGRPTTVVLFSDMLHSTPEIDMERPGGVPSASWLTTRKEAGQLPDLTGACIVAVGADVATARSVPVRRFWEAYFQQTGARMPKQNYRTLISDPAELKCP